MLQQLRALFIEMYGPRFRRLILFGSQARGDARPWSDVDIALILADPVYPPDERDRTLNLSGVVSLANNLVPMCLYVGEAEYTTSDDLLFRNIRGEGIEI